VNWPTINTTKVLCNLSKIINIATYNSRMKKIGRNLCELWSKRSNRRRSRNTKITLRWAYLELKQDRVFLVHILSTSSTSMIKIKHRPFTPDSKICSKSKNSWSPKEWNSTRPFYLKNPSSPLSSLKPLKKGNSISNNFWREFSITAS